MDERAPVPAPPAASDGDALIASLREAGAARFDPVRLHYAEALARRARAHQGSVRRLLDARLAQAAHALRRDFEQAQSAAAAAVADCAARHPQAADRLRQLLASNDFHEVRRAIAALRDAPPAPSLRELVRRLEDASAPAGAGVQDNAGGRAELKAIRHFRTTWSRLSADRQVKLALAGAPANAGPINSHMLVLRSLAAMRDISPDYLGRFLSYADTLLCLDQGPAEKAVAPKKPAAKSSKK